MAKHVIEICMGSSCFARGNDRNLGIIERFLADRGLEAEVLLRGSRCRDCCSQGPNISVDGILYGEVSRERMEKILESCLTGKGGCETDTRGKSSALR